MNMGAKFFICLGIIATNIVGCKKNLDLPPPDQILNSQYWKTAQHLETYMLQFYSFFPHFKNLGSTAPDFFLGTMGTDAVLGSDHQVYTAPATQLNGTRTATISGGNWNWINIRSVNIFFENYQKVNEAPDKIHHFVGEAHFFKAWFYFEKLRLFGDVPWYTNSMLIDDPALYNPRNKRTEVADSILWHLDRAIEKLALRKDAPGGNNRLSKEVALIFKSRVALFEGSWQKYHAGTAFATAQANPNKYFQAAVDAVTELQTPAKYTVGITNTGKPGSDYNSLFSSTNLAANPEVALWTRYDATQASFAHNFQQFITSNTNNVSVTYQLVQNYLARTGLAYDYGAVAATVKGTAFLRKISTDCDPRMGQVFWIPGQTMWYNSGGPVLFTKPFLEKTGSLKNHTGFQLNKGVDPKDPTAGGVLGFSTSCETGAVIFRYAEALLNYAEAKLELGQAPDYNASLNLLRSRAGMPVFRVIADANRLNYADWGYSITDELNEVRRERAVELACEGFRYDDWRRWRAHNLFLNKRPLGFPYLASEYAASLVVQTNAAGFVDPFRTMIPGGYKFIVGRDYLESIPVNERTLNPSLTQNPGW
jgi:hypothetical protein